MNRAGVFPKLHNVNAVQEASLPIVYRSDHATFYKHLHFLGLR